MDIISIISEIINGARDIMISSLMSFAKKGRIFCYGVGVFGQVISSYCKKQNIRICGYLVTSIEENPHELYGIQVSRINDVILNEDDGVIIAAIKKKNIEDMSNAIQSLAISARIYLPFQNEDFVNTVKRDTERKRLWLSKKRRKYNIFNYTALREPMELFFPYNNPVKNRIVTSNKAYGHDYIIKRYLKQKKYNLDESTVMHSVVFSNYLTERESAPPDNNIFSMNKIGNCSFYSKDIINNYAIGPYILRVRPIVSHGRLAQIKRKLGKTLLLVPSHVIRADGNVFDIEDFIKEVEIIKERYLFDTVMCSIGPNGFRDKSYLEYIKCGYKIVTAGDTYDVNFLSRLRTFISLSDVTMGNDACSTFPGYSISLNKPYYHYNMQIDYTDANKANIDVGYLHHDKSAQERANAWKRLADLFGVYHEYITTKQRDFVKEYWGLGIKRRCNRDTVS